jgi:predicted PurR-regulated permease PerM
MIKFEPGENIIERALGLAILALLVIACFQIMAPFIGSLLWAIILTVSTWPLFVRLRSALGGRSKLAAALLAGATAGIFVLPLVLLAVSLADSVDAVSELLHQLVSAKLPEQPTWLAGVPLVGERLENLWRQGMTDMPALLEQAQPYIKQTTTWAVQQTATLGLAMLQFLLAVVISGFLYATGETQVEWLRRFAHRTGGERSATLATVAERTIRSVALGVIGTALLQGLLTWLGFAVASVPGSLLLAFITFLLAIMQLPTLLVWLPVALWFGYQGQTGWTIFIVVWGLVVVGSVDNFVRPYLISQGAHLPLLLIFAGVLGGLLAWGLIGIFLGATLLAVGFTLLRDWLAQDDTSVITAG